MGTLHLVDGPTAAGSLRAALEHTPGRTADSVEWFPDGLCNGPLAPDDPAVRDEWWRWWDEMMTVRFGEVPGPTPTRVRQLAAFWEVVDEADHLVVWYGRDNASESAFFHAVCDRLGDRPFDVVALPGAIGARDPQELAEQLSAARPISAAERSATQCTWQSLVQENETFRIVRNGLLVSAPADHYDRALLEAAGSDWTSIARIIAPVMASENVGDSVLIWRVKTLIESGALIADGDPWLAQHTRVKHPQPQPI